MKSDESYKKALESYKKALDMFEKAKSLRKDIIACWVSGSLARYFLMGDSLYNSSDVDMLIITEGDVESELGIDECRKYKLRSVQQLKKRLDEEMLVTERTGGRVFNFDYIVSFVKNRLELLNRNKFIEKLEKYDLEYWKRAGSIMVKKYNSRIEKEIEDIEDFLAVGDYDSALWLAQRSLRDAIGLIFYKRQSFRNSPKTEFKDLQRLDPHIYETVRKIFLYDVPNDMKKEAIAKAIHLLKNLKL